jgi:glycerol dehydrogenase
MSGRTVVYRSVPRFVQGPGILDTVGGHATSLCPGGKVCIIVDPGVRFLLETVEASLNAHRIRYAVREFDGDLRKTHADRLAEQIQAEEKPELLIGVGGGKAIDLSKLLAHRIGARNIVVVTAAATDAATSHAAVALDESGHISAENYDHPSDLVLVDSTIIARAPVRLFVAGIGDAISKRHEMRTAVSLGEQNFGGGRPPFFIESMAETLYTCLLEKAVAARDEVQRQVPGPAMEEVATACLLLSTLVWENGGLAGAHSIANVLFNSGQFRQSLHGEQVAYGLLLHLTLEEQQAELSILRPFYQAIRLPRRLSALGPAGMNPEAIHSISEGIHERWHKHNIRYTAEAIEEAIWRLENS